QLRIVKNKYRLKYTKGPQFKGDSFDVFEGMMKMALFLGLNLKWK
ncbi:unnamed protein product, partial [Allacma fusca]